MKQGRNLEDQLWVLGSGVRLQILSRLQQRPAQVRDLAKELRWSQPTISRHIKYLLNAGFVDRSQQAVYAARTDQVGETLHTLRSRLHIGE